MSPVSVAAEPIATKPDGSAQDLWAEALKSLPLEDQQEFKGLGGNMLGLSRGVSNLFFSTPSPGDVDYDIQLSQVLSPICTFMHRFKQQQRARSKWPETEAERSTRRKTAKKSRSMTYSKRFHPTSTRSSNSSTSVSLSALAATLPCLGQW